MSGALKNLLAYFNEYFSDYLISDQEDEAPASTGVCVSLPFKLMLPQMQPLLSPVEY